jgi:hypothetical protein
MVGGTTTAGDCAQVRAALVAVEMDAQPVSCAPAKPPTVCPVGRSPRTLYFNDMETSIAEWIGGPEPGYEGGEVGLSTYYATSGSRSLFIDDPATVSHTRLVLNRAISVPAGSETYLRFNHAYDLEGTATGADILDGGQVRYSVDGGETWTNATSLFVATGYTGTVLASGSPMVGRPAFGHWSYGYGTSVIRLSSLGGQDVRLGYWVATDSANRRYQYGWYLDDVWVYACEVTATPTPWARAADHYVASLITRLLAPTSTPTPTATPSAGS